jgi:hypothetical protein
MRPLLRRLGRVVFCGIAFLAITACVTLLYFHYVQHRRSGEPQRLLDQADALAWNNLLRGIPYRAFHHASGPALLGTRESTARAARFKQSSCE